MSSFNNLSTNDHLGYGSYRLFGDQVEDLFDEIIHLEKLDDCDPPPAAPTNETSPPNPQHIMAFATRDEAFRNGHWPEWNTSYEFAPSFESANFSSSSDDDNQDTPPISIPTAQVVTPPVAKSTSAYKITKTARAPPPRAVPQPKSVAPKKRAPPMLLLPRNEVFRMPESMTKQPMCFNRPLILPGNRVFTISHYLPPEVREEMTSLEPYLPVLITSDGTMFKALQRHPRRYRPQPPSNNISQDLSNQIVKELGAFLQQ